MALFLIGHVLDGLNTGRRAFAPLQNGKLALIDAHGAIFPSMIHPDHGFDIDR
jgi:hypothetical protein